MTGTPYLPYQYLLHPPSGEERKFTSIPCQGRLFAYSFSYHIQIQLGKILSPLGIASSGIAEYEHSGMDCPYYLFCDIFKVTHHSPSVIVYYKGGNTTKSKIGSDGSISTFIDFFCFHILSLDRYIKIGSATYYSK